MSGVMLLILGTGSVFIALLLALTALGVLSSEMTGVGRSLAAIQAFGAAPPELREELEPSFSDRVVVPLRARTVKLGRKLTPADNAARIRYRLDVAGNPAGWTVDRVVSLKVIGFVVGLLGSLFIAAQMGLGFMPRLVVCVGVALFGYVAVNVWLYNVGSKRTAQMQKDLPDAIDLLTISVEAGLGFDAAMAQVARNTVGPVAAEFARLLQEMQIGMARSQAMRSLGDRTILAELRGFANAMVQADALGIPVSKVLRIQAQEMRVKRRQRAEEKAQQVAVKVLFPLMLCILPILFIVVMGPPVISFVTR
ncbi:MAG: tight adherence protein [Nocardioidaceae bacterium]|nr:tight adherence protein [Nocardioidaceae bacterium]